MKTGLQSMMILLGFLLYYHFIMAISKKISLTDAFIIGIILILLFILFEIIDYIVMWFRKKRK